MAWKSLPEQTQQLLDESSASFGREVQGENLNEPDQYWDAWWFLYVRTTSRRMERRGGGIAAL